MEMFVQSMQKIVAIITPWYKLASIFGNLDTTPPVSINSESFYKAAGCEIVKIMYGSIVSNKRQIMNQADYFYYSGHGRHSDASLQGLENGPRLTPSLVS